MNTNKKPQGVREYIKNHHQKKKWLTVVTCMACAVVFCTVYALVLPAITLESDQTTASSNTVHEHSSACYDENNNLICGMEDYALHTHDENCYDDEGNLICTLPEIEAHEHDSSSDAEQPALIGSSQQEEEHIQDEECIDSADADDGIALMSADADETIPKSVLEQLAADYGIYPGTLNENGTWTAIDGATEEKAMIRATVKLPDSTSAEENSYLFIRKATAESKDPYYPNAETVKNAVGEVNEYQCYAIHWVKIYRDNNASVGEYKDDNGDVIGYVYADSGNKANHWVCIYATSSTLSEEKKAEIQIEYLNEKACLAGNQGNRKLRIFNSRNADGKTLEENSTATGVTATPNTYKGFTFTTNRGGPYVFVSQKVFEGYVKELTMGSVLDGTAPFDSNDSAGNDSANDNKIVRSYDVIQYNLTATLGARQSGVTAKEATLYFEMSMAADLTKASFDVSQMLWMDNNYIIYYLNSKEEVLYWQDAAAYSAGKYYYLGESAADPTPTAISAIGVAQGSGRKTASLNAIVSHSTNGEKSYASKVTAQRLVGHYSITAGSSSTDNNVLAAQKPLSAAVQVLNAENESVIQPAFKVWLEGNEANYGSESGDGDSIHLSEIVKDNQVKSERVTVSSSAKFNLELKTNSNVTYRGWFDSSTGLEITSNSAKEYAIKEKTVTGAQLYSLLEKLAVLTENFGKSNPEDFTDIDGKCSSDLNGLLLDDYDGTFSKIRYGRITGYGLTLQVYNDETGGNNTAAKGFKGISLPQGDITFALDLATTTKVSGNDKVDANQYYPMLWEYSENENVRSNYEYTYADPYIGKNGKVSIQGNGTGNQGRNMYWANLDSTAYASWSATYNGLYVGNGDMVHSNYYGGAWELNDSSDDHGYKFTVSGYDFNFTSAGMIFPTIKAGHSSVTAGYNSYIGCFSSGQLQVLNVFPRYQTATVNVDTTVTVKNLTLTTTDGTAFRPSEGDGTGYAQETNTNDNQVSDNIPLYKPGSMTKANAFCTSSFFKAATTANLSSPSYFLGTNFWNNGYDCSAYAGQDITLVGAARINAGDYAIHSMNILQLFDSKALTLNLEEGDPYVVSNVTDAVRGETKILYAADPDYPGGYDTNDENVMKYMSTIREEDLDYYTDLKDLEKAGYTCIGVLAELRDWTIYGEGGYNTVLKIPMKVSQSADYVGKTVATVNAVRIWTNAEDMRNVSWEKGSYNKTTGKNSVDGYVDVNFGSIEHYSGEVVNSSAYEKTEYENNQIILGTNTGGYVYGSSLLILGYRAEVDIEVDKEAETSYPTYDLDEGQYTVAYRLNGIIARKESIGSAQDTPTNLIVTAKLDEDYTSDKYYTSDMQRISVSNGTYKMTFSKSVILYKTDEDGNLVVDESGNPTAVDSVEISDNSETPTVVKYALLDDQGKVVTDDQGKPIIYTIKAHAAPDTNGTQVVFYLSDVTVGISVPEITFDAEIKPEKVANNDHITSYAYVSGTSDVRAYSEVNGNKDSADIGIIQLGATRLVKSVDTRYIELSGDITYTVTYTNSGSGALGTLYLNDLLPDNSDTRGSGYKGKLELTGVAAKLSGNKEFSADVKFYYSTKPYAELRKAVDLSNAENRNPGAINGMLDKYFHPLGEISSGNSNVEYSDEFKHMSDDKKAEITGIYAVVTGLQGGNSINLEIKTKALGNAAGDVYKNVAYSWIEGSDSGELVSNQVETTVLSRTISGVVWYDANLNGVQDSGEAAIPGADCTLFKWDSTQKKYIPCTTDVTGRTIETVATDSYGAYRFDKLAAGDYIVAFSGTELEKYTGATAYQTGSDTTVNNDAVALIKTDSSLDTERTLSLDGDSTGKYKYAIAYNLTEDAVGNVPLHSIPDIVSGNITLVNHVELYKNLNCGLVTAGYELPETGGAGTILFTISGLVFMTGAAGYGYRLRRRRERRMRN